MLVVEEAVVVFAGLPGTSSNSRIASHRLHRTKQACSNQFEKRNEQTYPQLGRHAGAADHDAFERAGRVKQRLVAVQGAWRCGHCISVESQRRKVTDESLNKRRFVCGRRDVQGSLSASRGQLTARANQSTWVRLWCVCTGISRG